MLIQDIRFGVRTLSKKPGFALVAVMTLALGIGANTAMFSAVNGVLLRPMPVAEADQIVQVDQTDAHGESPHELSYPDYVDLRARTESLSGLLGHKLAHVALTSGADNDIVWGELVTGNYFDVLRVQPALGRGFLPEEDATPGSHPVAVISDSLWRRRFGADPSLPGKAVSINGRPFTVVGVAPASFKGTKFGLALDIWVPLMMYETVPTGVSGTAVLEDRGMHWLETIGRLKPGVTAEQAQTELRTIASSLAVDHPDTNRNTSIAVFPERDVRFGEGAGNAMKLAGLLLMMLVGLVLLIACANVSNLLLARSSSRRREIGIRLAMGARRARVIRLLLTESFVLAALGGILGVLVAQWATNLIFAFMPAVPYPVDIDTSPDARVLVFSTLVTLLTTFVFGLAPALETSKVDLVSVLKSDTPSGGRRHRLRDALVVAQIAISFTLLVGAGHFARSLVNAQTVDPGFEAKNVLFASVDLDLLQYDATRGQVFYRDLVDRVERLPGVTSASVIDSVPLGDSHSSTGAIAAEGTALVRPEDGLEAGVMRVSPGHFATLGVPLVRGRDFTAQDDADAPQVAIVNEAFADRLWPGEDPVGRRFTIGLGANAQTREVVGETRTGKYWTLGEQPLPFMYRPLRQSYSAGMTLLVRTEGASPGLAGMVRDSVRGLEPNLPVYDVKSLSEHLGRALWPARAGAWLSGLFSVLALLLAIVGLYGMMSFTVAQQTRDIGLRIALGAKPRDVLRYVVGRGVLLTLVGMGIGLAGAVALTKVVGSLLYGVSGTDPVVLGGIAVLLGGAAVLASYLPARRAATVDAMVALRYE